MGTRDAGSMRKQDQTCSFSCFVLFYHESQTVSLHSKMAVSTPELGKSIQELIVLNDSTLPNFHEPSSHCLEKIRGWCHQTKPNTPAEEEDLWPLEPGSQSFIWTPVHFE